MNKYRVEVRFKGVKSAELLLADVFAANLNDAVYKATRYVGLDLLPPEASRWELVIVVFQTGVVDFKTLFQNGQL